MRLLERVHVNCIFVKRVVTATYMKPVKNNRLSQSHRSNNPTKEAADSPADYSVSELDTFKRLLAQYKAKVYEKYASAF